MKVFRLNDCDWVAAETLEQAVEWYMKETGLDREDALDPALPPYECASVKLCGLQLIISLMKKNNKQGNGKNGMENFTPGFHSVG